MLVLNWRPSTFEAQVEIVSKSKAKLTYSDGDVRYVTLTVNKNYLVKSFGYSYEHNNANVVCTSILVKQ